MNVQANTSEPRTSSFDVEMMRQAIAMAERGLGRTAPNPSVGAVIADEATGELIARGWTQPGGRPHAETEAIKRAGERAHGKTLYVTLEPCAHTGKTPPCADAIINAGLSRVVVGTDDPDPRTAGQGIAKLKAAGIMVSRALEPACRWLTLGHSLRITERRPFVTLKIAVGGDGTVPQGADGQPTWATGPLARARGHLMRAEADAILVGSGTLAADNPDLTCRLPGLVGHSPVRVILSSAGTVAPNRKAVQNQQTAPTWIITGADAKPTDQTALEAAGVQFLNVTRNDAGLDLTECLTELAEKGITRLLVEGGPQVWQAFAAAGLVDAVTLLAAGHLDDPNAVLTSLAPGLALNMISTRRLGPDTVHEFRATRWEDTCSQA